MLGPEVDITISGPGLMWAGADMQHRNLPIARAEIVGPIDQPLSQLEIPVIPEPRGRGPLAIATPRPRIDAPGVIRHTR